MKQLLEKYRELIRYLIVGVLTTMVSLFLYFLCVETILNPEVAIELQIANIISWIGAVSFAYVTNRIYVFESKNSNIGKEMLLFFVARIGSLVLDMGIMFLAVTVMGVNDKIAKLFVQAVVIVSNYILSKLIVFRRQ